FADAHAERNSRSRFRNATHTFGEYRAGRHGAGWLHVRPGKSKYHAHLWRMRRGHGFVITFSLDQPPIPEISCLPAPLSQSRSCRSERRTETMKSDHEETKSTKSEQKRPSRPSFLRG